MATYVICSVDMDLLVERMVADPIVDWRGGELTFIETFQFTRTNEPDWNGPYAPRQLLEDILNANDIEFELKDEDHELTKESVQGQSDEDAVEEEARNLHNVETRLNKFGDKE